MGVSIKGVVTMTAAFVVAVWVYNKFLGTVSIT